MPHTPLASAEKGAEETIKTLLHNFNNFNYITPLYSILVQYLPHSKGHKLDPEV